MRAVPCQEKVDILAGILLLRCKIKSNRKSCIAVDGAMTDIPVWSNSYALLTNLLHWIEKISSFSPLASLPATPSASKAGAVFSGVLLAT